MHHPLLQCKHLTVTYSGKTVLSCPELSIPQGKRIAIIGPNGAGKSTFLKALLGLVPYQGEILLLGQTASQGQSQVAFLSQHQEVNWHFPITVKEVIQMGFPNQKRRFNFLSTPQNEDLDILLQQMRLTDIQDQPIRALSGGQKQRVFLARALAQKAQAYFLDEPLAGLDKMSEAIIMDTLKALQEDHKSSMTVHHDLNTVKDYFDYVIMINRHVLTHGPLDTTFTHENLSKTFIDLK